MNILVTVLSTIRMMEGTVFHVHERVFILPSLIGCRWDESDRAKEKHLFACAHCICL